MPRIERERERFLHEIVDSVSHNARRCVSKNIIVPHGGPVYIIN